MQLYRGDADTKGAAEAMNKRQTDILKILYKDRNYITFGEIAERMNVSVKTVRNDIAAIKEALAAADAGTIETKPHAGVRLISSADRLENLKSEDEDEDKDIFFFIIRHLFRKNDLTAQRLAQQYYLGRAQLDKILEKTAQWFNENHIVFERRRGKGISIRYSEFNYRTALVNFCTEYADMYAELITEREAPHSVAASRDYTAICAALEGFDAAPAAKAVAELEHRFGIKFEYASGVRLLMMVSLGMLRSRSGNRVEVPKVRRCAVDGESDLKMAKALAESLGTEVPPEEFEYLKYAVAISEIREFESDGSRQSMEVMNTELCRMTIKIVNLISDIAAVDLRGDKFFVRQMFLQLKVTIARLKYGIVFKNQLLGRIKTNYPNMMAAAWLLGNVFEKELKLEINEHEVGYIALHIGGAIERQLAGVSACIVCDYGVGISQIIKEKIARAIPDLRITEIFSSRDMRKIKSEQCDFIIAATPLGSYRLNRDIVEIKHLPDENDIKMLENHIRSVRLKRRGGIKNITPNKSLFNRELIFPKCTAKNKTELLQMLCSKLEITGYVTGKFEKSVFEREESTSTDIGKGFAVPHGLSRYVNHSAAAFATLETPIEWNDGGELTDVVFLLAFDLDEDEKVKEEIIGFYKSVVSFMEDEDECKKLRELTDKDEIIKIFEKW